MRLGTTPPLKTGAGRSRGKPPAVADVETLPCPATLGAENHELVNDARAVTTCRWCRETWSALDEAVRAG